MLARVHANGPSGPPDAHVLAWEMHNEREGIIQADRAPRRARMMATTSEIHGRPSTPQEQAGFAKALMPTPAEWPAPLDLEALAERAPQKPQFIIPDWLPASYATLFSGHGGAGKSAIAMHLAVCLAKGCDFFGLACERRRVLYLSCEDREPVLHWRLAHIAAYSAVDIASLRGWLDILDLVGRDTILWTRDLSTGNTLTGAFAELAARIEGQRTQVLIVDGISDAFGGGENTRVEVKAFVNALLGLIPLDGALLLLGHVAKPTAASGASGEGYSGSTQWHNAVRARWYLYPEVEKADEGGRDQRTGKLTLELQKSNLGRTDSSIGFEWDADAHLFVASSAFGTSAIDRKHRDQTEQAAILRALRGCAASIPTPIVVPAAMQGQRTAYHVLSKRPEFPDSLRSANGATRRRFWGQIESLRQLNLVSEREYRRANRHHGAEFVLTSEGMRQCAE